MFSLAELLQAKGYEVVPFCASHRDNLPTPWSSYFPPGISFQSPSATDLVNFVYSKRAAQAMRQIISARRPNVAHLHIYYGQLTASILRPLAELGIPIVQTLHEYKLVCPVYTLMSDGKPCEKCSGSHYWHALVNRCNRNSVARSALSTVEAYVSKMAGAMTLPTHFIAVSDFLRRKVVEMGVPAEKITTIHNFIDTAAFPVNTQVGRYLLYFGRIERIKGIFTLLEAMRPLKHIQLVVAGTGSAAEEAMAFVQREGLGHVTFVGFKSGQELNDLIRGSLATVSPSEWYETFGLTLAESMAHCRPVLASAIGGMTEVVTHGVDGYLTQPGNPIDLREAIEEIFRHPNRAVEMGLAGRAKVEVEFGAQRHFEGIERVYRAIGAVS